MQNIAHACGLQREDERIPLIRLMVVVLIIAILIAIAIPFLGAQSVHRTVASRACATTSQASTDSRVYVSADATTLSAQSQT
jgi:type II secretory pathway pseudopilin PulG